MTNKARRTPGYFMTVAQRDQLLNMLGDAPYRVASPTVGFVRTLTPIDLALINEEPEQGKEKKPSPPKEPEEG